MRPCLFHDRHTGLRYHRHEIVELNIPREEANVSRKGFALFAFLKGLFGKTETHAPAPAEDDFVVSLVDGEIVVLHPQGTIEQIKLAELQAVLIETNDSGPWGPDLWWILVGAPGEGGNHGCVFPGGATGEMEVLTALQELPGFDHGAVIEAMGSTSDARFLCWKAEA